MHLPFKCKLCIFNCTSRSERDKHIDQHFEYEFCPKCNKYLIKIGERWFELHVSTNCHYKENEHKTNFVSQINGYEWESKPSRLSETDLLIGHDRKRRSKTKRERDVETEHNTKTVPNFDKESYKANDNAALCTDINLEPLAKELLSENVISSVRDQRIPVFKEVSTEMRPRVQKSDKKRDESDQPQAEDKFNRSTTCNECGKTYKTYAILRQHKHIHIDYRRYICDLCGKGFRTSHILNEHKLIHTGERPHRCDVCTKSFRTKTHVIAHKRIHTGEKLNM